MSLAISVVVPTFHRDSSLAECLDRLLAQSFEPSRYEIIVADDGVSESTRRVVASHNRPGGPAVHYVPVVLTQGPAGARNSGWRRSRAPVIAFTDDDCQPDSDWLSAGWHAIRDADAVSGRTVVPLPDRPTDGERDTGGLADAPFITANCFCRRSALETIGGFDEQFTAAWREDSDLHFQLLRCGMKIIRAPAAVVVHPAFRGRWGVSLVKQRRGIFDPLLYRKHPDLYRRHIPPLPRWYYVAMLGLAMAAAGGVARQPMVTLSGASLWLMLTGRFVAQRLQGASAAVSHVLEMVVTSALIPPLSVYWRLRGALRYGAWYW